LIHILTLNNSFKLFIKILSYFKIIAIRLGALFVRETEFFALETEFFLLKRLMSFT